MQQNTNNDITAPKLQCSTTSKTHLTLSLLRSSIDDLVFSVFTSIFFKLSYKISLLKNQFVTFSSDFHKIFKRPRLFTHASDDVQFVP